MTKFLDLDAIHQDMTDVTVRLAGETHKLKPLSVLDFIENQKTLAEMVKKSGDAIGDLQADIEGTIVMVNRSFPTMTAGGLRSLSANQLRKLLLFTRLTNGEITQAVYESANGQAEAPKATDVPSAPVPPEEAASIGSENPPQA